MRLDTRVLAIVAATLPAAVRAAEPPTVVASIPPVHSLVAGVMQGIATPELLIAAVASPHDAQLRPSEAGRLADADAVVWIGAGLESALARPIGTLAGDAAVLTLSRASGLTLLPSRRAAQFFDGNAGDHGNQHKSVDHAGATAAVDGEGRGETHSADAAAGSQAVRENGAIDPHIWLDPQNAIAMTNEIARFLADLDPGNAKRYRANATRVAEDLSRLTEEVSGRLQTVRATPAIVFHDAYQYMEVRFRLRIVATVTVNPEIPPGVRQVRELQGLIASQNVVCIFTEPQFRPQLVTILTEGTDARTAALDPLGVGLTPGPNLYAQLIRRNADALVDCLAPT